MGETTWTAYGTETNALTTELNSLADAAESALGTEIDNTTNRDMYMDLNVVLASLAAATAPFIVVKVYTSVDGTNYEDGDAAPSYSMQVDAATSAKRGSIRGILLSPGKHKLTLTNECNVALAATGNTVKYRTYGPTTA